MLHPAGCTAAREAKAEQDNPGEDAGETLVPSTPQQRKESQKGDLRLTILIGFIYPSGPRGTAHPALPATMSPWILDALFWEGSTKAERDQLQEPPALSPHPEHCPLLLPELPVPGSLPRE